MKTCAFNAILISMGLLLTAPLAFATWQPFHHGNNLNVYVTNSTGKSVYAYMRTTTENPDKTFSKDAINALYAKIKPNFLAGPTGHEVSVGIAYSENKNKKYACVLYKVYVKRIETSSSNLRLNFLNTDNKLSLTASGDITYTRLAGKHTCL